MISIGMQQLSHLHAEDYTLWDPYLHGLCGPCYFREGFREELPSRVTIRERSGLFGAPAINPQLIQHIELSFGLIPPDPGESLKRWRRRRDRLSERPAPKVFPFGSALWNLMNYQPPLARVLVKFCQGKDEVTIADEMDLSLFNVHERMVKAVRTGQRFLNNGITEG
jgi:hypothetical protein